MSAIINTSLNTAIDNSTLAEAIMANVPEVCGVYYKDLPLALLDVHPTIQRELSDHYLRIAENFDINKCDPLTVSWKENGTFLIIDGQHRYMAAKQKGINTLPCRVFKNLTEEEEARMFYTQNENNKRLTPRDMLKAKLVVEEDNAVILRNLCNKHGVFLFREGDYDIPWLKALADMEKIIGHWGANVAEMVFKFIEAAGWHDDVNGYSTYTVRPIMTLWRKLYIKFGHEDPSKEVLEVAETINGMPLDQFVATANAMFPHSTTHMAVYELFRKIYDSNCDPNVFLLETGESANPKKRSENIA